jgi:phosphoribosylformylglycinamidine synthase
MKSAVVVFPGSNRDHDMIAALTKISGRAPVAVWHADTDLPAVDLIVLPGGFSYGDYLRSGAIAARAPIMRAVAERAAAGVPVLGVCNGFQILCEAGLLPGVLMRNASLRFVCREVGLRVETTDSLFTRQYRKGAVIRCPVAHGDGNYRCDDATLARLRGEDRIVFRYAALPGSAATDANPNGSLDDIAGICDATGRIVGLMPHPDRAADPRLGNTDGLGFFTSMMTAAVGGGVR